ncbi:MAG: NAD(P)-binding protein [Pseudomonadota bacterium]|nr:NAD(P)-binding protein [Pseudomonadota bacterium]
MHPYLFQLVQRYFPIMRDDLTPERQELVDANEVSKGNTIIFLVMRRMRLPLLVLISVYTIAVVGMTLVPGQDDQGQLWYMDFFHAFYFVSYMGTTIGFGEIPYAFSGAQRLWAIFSIYLTVIAWIYAIGALLTLLQEEALRRALTERRFARTVTHIHQPFYLICGYGDTGQALVGALEEHFLRSVVIEIKHERINVLKLENYPVFVPKLCADASKPNHLVHGGLTHPHCAAVVALTDDSLANLHIAITTKLLRPELKVIARVDCADVAANMNSFGTDHIIDPFEVFAEKLHTAIRSPYLYMLRSCLSSQHDLAACKPLNPPRQGIWILCGYGRFGRALYQEFKKEKEIHLIIIEATPEATGYPTSEYVIGRGTEADTLLRARVQEAVGLVAGTNDDVNNLSIVMTARMLNPKLFVVIRQNLADNKIIFDAAQADIVMQASQIMANYIRLLLNTPLLFEFLTLARHQQQSWLDHLLYLLKGVLPNQVPYVWELSITAEKAPALCDIITYEKTISLECLLRDPRQREVFLPCLPLLLIRGEQKILLPELNEYLEVGDQLLWCGTETASLWMEWALRDALVLAYLSSGKTIARSYVWRWFQQRLQQK